jgi:hypothetical protein
MGGYSTRLESVICIILCYHYSVLRQCIRNSELNLDEISNGMCCLSSRYAAASGIVYR